MLTQPRQIRQTRQLIGYFCAKLLPGLVTFASIPIILRTYGDTDYGAYSRLWAASSISASLGCGWIRQSVLRHSGRRSHSARELPIWVVAVSLLITAAPIGGYALADSGGRLGLDRVLGIAIVSSVMAASWGLYSIKLAATQRSGNLGRYNTAEVLRTLTSLAVPAALGFLGMATSLATLLLLTVLGNVVAASVIWTQDATTARGRSATTAIQFWTYGWPMSLWLGISTLTLYSDRFIVNATVGGSRAGEYAAVSDLIIRGIGMAAFPVAMTAHPRIMATYNAGAIAEAMRMIRSWSKIILSLTFAAAVCGAFIAPWMLQMTLGPVHVGRFTVMTLICAASLWQYALLAHKYHELAGRTLNMLTIMVVSWLAGAGSGFLLSSAYGALGAAIGTLVGTLVYLVAITASRPTLAHI